MRYIIYTHRLYIITLYFNIVIEIVNHKIQDTQRYTACLNW